MKIRISITLATSLAIALATTANAVPMPTLTPGSTTTDPLGIDNLVVDGTIYDVTFSTTTPNTFTKGTTLSVDSATALANTLKALGVTELDGISANDYLVVVDSTLSFSDGAVFAVGGAGWFETPIDAASLGFTSTSGSDVDAADFTPVGTVTAPEPFTLSLFGAGLLGAAAMRRRKAK